MLPTSRSTEEFKAPLELKQNEYFGEYLGRFQLLMVGLKFLASSFLTCRLVTFVTFGIFLTKMEEIYRKSNQEWYNGKQIIVINSVDKPSSQSARIDASASAIKESRDRAEANLNPGLDRSDDVNKEVPRNAEEHATDSVIAAPEKHKPSSTSVKSAGSMPQQASLKDQIATTFASPEYAHLTPKQKEELMHPAMLWYLSEVNEDSPKKLFIETIPPRTVPQAIKGIYNSPEDAEEKDRLKRFPAHVARTGSDSEEYNRNVRFCQHELKEKLENYCDSHDITYEQLIEISQTIIDRLVKECEKQKIDLLAMFETFLKVLDLIDAEYKKKQISTRFYVHMFGHCEFLLSMYGKEDLQTSVREYFSSYVSSCPREYDAKLFNKTVFFGPEILPMKLSMLTLNNIKTVVNLAGPMAEFYPEEAKYHTYHMMNMSKIIPFAQIIEVLKSATSNVFINGDRRDFVKPETVIYAAILEEEIGNSPHDNIITRALDLSKKHKIDMRSAILRRLVEEIGVVQHRIYHRYEPADREYYLYQLAQYLYDKFSDQK